MKTVKTKPRKRNRKQTAVAAKPKKTVLVLRTCAANMKSFNDFAWPASGPVEAKDWLPTKQCGNGLHGWLWGEGDASLGNWDGNAKWLVVEVVESDVIDLQGKVKFPRGDVVHCGDRLSATAYVSQYGGISRAIIGGTATAGDRGTATAGYRGTATAGYGGTATAGFGGTATAGDRGTATAGDRGTATAGDRGTICVRWWDEAAQRYRLALGYVGEDGIKANTKYRVEGGKLVETK